MIEAGQFGLLPQFATELAHGRKTYNARSETVHALRSFKDSWMRSRRCIVPASPRVPKPISAKKPKPQPKPKPPNPQQGLF